MKVTLIQSTPDPITLIANAASICYGKEESKNPVKLVNRLYKSGHLSVFEHVYFTYKIEGITRACLAQLTRHRQASYTVMSQRYTDCSSTPVVNPPTIDPDNWIISDPFVSAVAQSQQSYEDLINAGVPKEDARFVLMEGTTTNLYMSFNLREFMHICNERLCSHAQWEIRGLVTKMKDAAPKEIQHMLVPRCGTGTIRCLTPCASEMEANRT